MLKLSLIFCIVIINCYIMLSLKSFYLVDKKVDDFWEFIVNEIQNWEFRFEDVLLHSLTGVIIAIGMKIKQIFKKIKSFIFHKYN